MAQADAKEDLQDVKDLNIISKNLGYYLKSVKSKNYLKGNAVGPKNSKQVFMSPDYKIMWQFEQVDDNIYGLTVGRDHYLESPDSRKDGKNPRLIKNGDPKKYSSQRWRVIKVKENKVALQAVKSELYLSGRNGQSDPTMQVVGTASAKTPERKDGQIDEYLQWWLIPIETNYTLNCYLSEFDFGDSTMVKKRVNEAKKDGGDSSMTVEVDADSKGRIEAVDPSITHVSSFSWSLGDGEAIGFDIESSCTVDVPLMVPDDTNSTTVSTSFEIEENESNSSKWETEELEKKYTIHYEFTPKKSGTYKVTIAADETRNVSLDFEAKVKYEAKHGKDTILDGNELEAILFYHQTSPKVYRSGTVKGTMQATYVIGTKVDDKKMK